MGAPRLSISMTIPNFMNLSRTCGRRALALIVVATTSGCAQPIMDVPPGFGRISDMYPVHGRQGLMLFNPAISFGPWERSHERDPPDGVGIRVCVSARRTERRALEARDR